MERFFRFARALFVLSLIASLGAAVFRLPRLSVWLATPALLFSAWAFVGHLVTLEDDYPGGWSNPYTSESNSMESSAFWHSSLRELAVKLVVFLTLSSFVLWQHLIAVSR